MMLKKSMRWFVCIWMAVTVTGCATHPASYDYTAFKESRPRSILILPPLNESPDVKATYGMLSQMTYPLAEAGYYVLPVALVDETFKQNGLGNPGDIHMVPSAKLREIFGADAALYVTVTAYGPRYTVLNSAVVVTANARLLDLRTGNVLWKGSASASNDEGNNNNSGGLAGALLAAVVKQVINNVSNAGYGVAGVTSRRLLSAGQANGILYGPYSHSYGTD